jgi:hypothetical protein
MVLKYSATNKAPFVQFVAVAQLVEALCYKPKRGGFDPQGVIGIFH